MFLLTYLLTYLRINLLKQRIKEETTYNRSTVMPIIPIIQYIKSMVVDGLVVKGSSSESRSFSSEFDYQPERHCDLRQVLTPHRLCHDSHETI